MQVSLSHQKRVFEINMTAKSYIRQETPCENLPNLVEILFIECNKSWLEGSHLLRSETFSEGCVKSLEDIKNYDLMLNPSFQVPPSR